MTELNTNHIICPICSCDKVSFITSNKRFEILFNVFQCLNPNCKHGFLSPLPSKKLLSEIYSNENQNDAFLSTEQDIQNQENHHKNVLKNAVEPLFNERGKLLDIGAGIGTFVWVAKKRNWDAVGIEYNEAAFIVYFKCFFWIKLATWIIG